MCACMCARVCLCVIPQLSPFSRDLGVAWDMELSELVQVPSLQTGVVDLVVCVSSRMDICFLHVVDIEKNMFLCLILE